MALAPAHAQHARPSLSVLDRVGISRPAVGSPEAGAADAGSGGLLEEALTLRYALFDLDGKTKRAIALDELVMAVSLETIEHEDDCRCRLCRAMEAVEGGSRDRPIQPPLRGRPPYEQPPCLLPLQMLE